MHLWVFDISTAVDQVTHRELLVPVDHGPPDGLRGLQEELFTLW